MPDEENPKYDHRLNEHHQEVVERFQKVIVLIASGCDTNKDLNYKEINI